MIGQIGQMAIAIALLGFNDLGHLVALFLFSETDFFYIIISTLSKNEQKISVGSLKNFKISVQRK